MEQSKFSRLAKALQLAVPNRPFTVTEDEIKRALIESGLILLSAEEFRNLMQNDNE